jgi:uncharacterized protein (TIGR04255 family)
MTLERPQHLADYHRPPLDEVVLGVQFEPVRELTAVGTRGVWELFRGDYPKVQEQPLIAPQFETFGGVGHVPSVKFQIGNAPVGSRLWFSSENESHLVQFQSDRLLLNWRRRPSSGEYPRFEGIASQFEALLDKLQEHISSEFRQELTINQCEVSYINVIPVSAYSEIPRWIKILQGFDVHLEGMSTVFTEAIVDQSNRPFARLTHEVQSAIAADGKGKLVTLSLTFRGRPLMLGTSGALEFMRKARDAIVTRFDAMTTQYAHDYWGKKE